jgi:hypothetical protein
MNKRRLAGLALGFILLMSSCGIVSQEVPTPTPTTAPTSTATFISMPTVISTPAPPMLSARSEVPCRAGPSDVYDLVLNLQSGEKVEIVGKAEAFWIVKPPASGECWVSHEQVDVIGEVASLPIVAPPPTPAPAAPARPEHLVLVKKKCSVDYSSKPAMYINEFWLKWTDKSNNEDGFHVYRDGDLVAEVPANKTDVIDVVSRRNKRVYYYSVAAYNELGESKSDVQAFSCGK